MRDIGLTLGKQDLEAAFKAIDKDGSGSLNFDEFLVKIRGNTLNKKRIVLVEKAFKKLDQNDNGTIEIDDLKVKSMANKLFHTTISYYLVHEGSVKNQLEEHTP